MPRAEIRHLHDEELASRALSGSGPAWDELVRRHSRRVVVTLLARGVALEIAEDLTQEAWLRLIQQQRAGRLAELRLPGIAIAQAVWLAREAARTRLRREAIAGWTGEHPGDPDELAMADPSEDPERLVIQRQRLQMIEAELQRVPRRAEAVFRAVYGPRARSHAQVAEELGLSLQRVRQILCEMRARLRHALQRMEGEDGPWSI